MFFVFGLPHQIKGRGCWLFQQILEEHTKKTSYFYLPWANRFANEAFTTTGNQQQRMLEKNVFAFVPFHRHVFEQIKKWTAIYTTN